MMGKREKERFEKELTEKLSKIPEEFYPFILRQVPRIADEIKADREKGKEEKGADLRVIDGGRLKGKSKL